MVTKEERLKSEEEHYNKRYANSKRISGWRIYEIKFFGKYLKNLNNKSLIEIGCGQGDAIKELNSELSLDKLKYVGIDISKEGIKKGKINYPNGSFLVGDCSSLEYKKNSFDAALCLGVLHHLPDPMGGLSELLRVTKKGGIIMLREPSEKSFTKGDSEYERGLKISKIFDIISKKGVK